MAISVGSVEVDIVPNTRNIYARLREGLVPAATRAGDDAGSAAGRAFGPAMQRQVGDIGLRIGEEIGQQIANRIVASLRDAIRDGVTQGGRTARPAAVRQGDETAGAFSRALKTRLEAAFRSLPKLQIGADTSEVDADLQAVRVRMETLADKRIGIDISAADAKAEIRLIEAELTRLGAEHPNVQVRADTAAALAQLAAVRAEIDAVDGKRAKIDVDTSGALSAIFRLTVALAGVAAIPAIPVLAAGIGAVGSAATVAAVGVGALGAVAIPAVIGIAGALQAQKAAQDAAATATAKGAQANSQAATRALQMAGAQQALALAERNGARQIAQAQGQVRQARQAVADATAQAAQRNAQAARQVQTAERSLADAQVAATRAQQDLTDARWQAGVELEDLANRYADAQLSQRDAALGLRQAQEQLNSTLADPRASQLQRAQAQLGYDQAVQRLKEQTTETKRLKVEQADAAKRGVEGSDTVRQAQERLGQAQRTVADQARAVRDAQGEAARTQVETARQVAEAQRRVGEATANVAVAQQSAADAVAGAQRQIASASLAAAGGVDQAATAQAKYQQALAKLSPAARGTFDAFVSLRSAFKAWSESLQPAVMPLFTRAIVGLKNSLPGLTPLVLAAARGIAELQDRASAGFKKPWWREFKRDVAGSIQPALVGLGVAFGNIFKGIAGVVQAFLPHMDSISSRMQDITARFATWGTGLKGSPAFERFLAYAAEQGPLVARTIGDISSAFYQVSRALSPLSGPLLEIIGALARGIASIATTLPWLIQGLYLVYVATKLWTIGVWALNLALDANPITLVIIAVVALAAAVVYAYQRFGWFRGIVDAAWAGIKAASVATWAFLQPVFAAFAAAFRAVGAAATWLWQVVLAPVFKAIGVAAATLIAIVLTILIAPLVLAFRLVGATATWLWTAAIGPTFRAIGALATWLWTTAIAPAFRGIAAGARWLYGVVLKPVFAAIGVIFRVLASTAKWLYEKALAPAFRAISSVAWWLLTKTIAPVFSTISSVINRTWHTGIRPAFNAIKSAVGAVAGAFRDARDAIGKAWAEIKKKTKDPINWVFKHVWNEGIVSIWKKIAGWVPGVPNLGKLPMLAAGGPMPMQPTMLNRPTAIVGEGNSRYPEYVIPTDPKYRGRAQALHQQAGMQLMASGGILGDIGDVIKASGGAAWDLFTGKASGADKLYKNPKGVIGGLLDPVLGLGKNLNKTSWGKMALGLPKMAVKALKSMAISLVNSSGGASPGVANALKWARGQAGKPYQWGGAGNPSWDCSGFMSGIQKKIQGLSPNGRLWSTFAFHGSQAPRGWKRHERSPFMIGVTNSGKGHTAGTLSGVNVESRGGDGVVVGNRARGYTDPLFGGNWYGFLPARGGGASGGTSGAAAKATARQMLGEFGFGQKQFPSLERLWQGESGWRYNAKNPSSGAYGIPQSLPASKMASAGADWKTNPATQIKWGLKYIKGRYGSPSRAYSTWAGRHPHWYDQGGYLQPGLNLAYNGTGRPEPVFTSQQASALTSRAADPASGLGDLQVQVFVGNREITDIARAEVRRSNGELLSTLRAGRTGV